MSDSFPRIGSFEQFQRIGSQKQIEALRQGANTSVRDASKNALIVVNDILHSKHKKITF